MFDSDASVPEQTRANGEDWNDALAMVADVELGLALSLMAERGILESFVTDDGEVGWWPTDPETFREHHVLAYVAEVRRQRPRTD